MKVAVVLLVKDEAAEILAWLGWYLALGVDTIIAYDDGSTDGTAELLGQAGVTADIRLTRLAPTNESFVHRQRAAYAEAIERHAQEFDWIGFLDADEYLALYEHPDVHAFLDRPDDVGSVATNWCNYGSDGHVFRPTSFPFVAYRLHYAGTEAVNRHVKSFMRPKLWTGRWQNVHHFDTARRTVDPRGRDVVWTAELGIAATEPDWSVAKIMHYQCRSMEHFLERMRKRDDLVATTRSWAEYDRGTEQDERPRARERLVRDQAFAFLLGVPPRLPDLLRGLAAPVAHPAVPVALLSNGAAPAFPESAGLLGRLRAAFGGAGAAAAPPRSAPATSAAVPAPAAETVEILLPLTLEGGRLTLDRDPGVLRVRDARQDGPETGREEGADTLHAVRLPRRPDRIFLLRLAGCDAPLVAKPDGRLAAALALDVVPLGDGRVALRHPTTGRHLCAVPPRAGGEVLLDRRFVKEWETFTVAPVERVPALTRQPAIAFLDRVAAAADRPAFLAASLDGAGEPRLVMALLPVWLGMLDDGAAARVRGSLGQGFCALVL